MLPKKTLSIALALLGILVSTPEPASASEPVPERVIVEVDGPDAGAIREALVATLRVKPGVIVVESERFRGAVNAHGVSPSGLRSLAARSVSASLKELTDGSAECVVLARVEGGPHRRTVSLVMVGVERGILVADETIALPTRTRRLDVRLLAPSLLNGLGLFDALERGIPR